MKITTDKKYYNEKTGKVYINGKARANIVPTPDKMDFTTAINYIERTFNKYGILSQCDRIVGLFRRGYDELRIRQALREKLSIIKDNTEKAIWVRAYENKLQKVKGN